MRPFIKTNLILLVTATSLFSCAKLDDKVDAGITIEKPTSVILDENVSSYDVLTSYAGDLVLGTNASSDDISGENPMLTLLKSNFSQLIPSAALKPNTIMADDGVCDFTSVNDFISKATENGFSVYGDAIVSNTDQNDTYLNTIGASLTYLTPLYPNIVDLSPIADGTFSGWGVTGDISVTDYMGEPSVKMVNGASVSSSDATSLQSPVYTVEDGAKFKMTFYLLSTQVGEGRVTFTGLNNNEPEIDWMGTGTKSSTFTTEIGWNAITFETSDFDNSGLLSFKIELGYTPDVTYYMNIQGLSLVNLNGSVDNPDEIFFEAEGGTYGSLWSIVDDANASGGKYAIVATATNLTTPGTDPKNNITYNINVKTAGTYSLWIRAACTVANGSDDSFHFRIDGGTWTTFNNNLTNTSFGWKRINGYTLTAGSHVVTVSYREDGAKLDRLYLTMTTNTPTGVGSAAITQKQVTLNVSDDVQKTAVEKALRDYVSIVISTLGEKINNWTVVKNPFAEDGSVAVSGGSTVSGTYYWADHIGDDYIAQAFSEAKANAASGSKLFIGETGLNTNAMKLEAVINAVNSNSNIDGVAVSLDSLGLDTDLDALGEMFIDLAATGKLISITNLSVFTTDATDESYALQSDVYESVLNLYLSKIPVSQRYGVSLAEPVGTVGLWDTNYNRKQAYAGFCIGLGAQ